MFTNLPKDIQEQIIHFLSIDDFPSAKWLYDQHQQKQSTNSQVKEKIYEYSDGK